MLSLHEMHLVSKMLSWKPKIIQVIFIFIFSLIILSELKKFHLWGSKRRPGGQKPCGSQPRPPNICRLPSTAERQASQQKVPFLKTMVWPDLFLIPGLSIWIMKPLPRCHKSSLNEKIYGPLDTRRIKRNQTLTQMSARPHFNSRLWVTFSESARTKKWPCLRWAGTIQETA